MIWTYPKAPDYKQLSSYETPVMTRIHPPMVRSWPNMPINGVSVRSITPVPKRLIQAYISAEDKTFYTHGGLDWRGIAAAGVRYIQVSLRARGRSLRLHHHER